ncbi:MAG: 3-isopropylmalate dehydrogenase [Chloroflexi bacterium]|nr:3-isopropylmalate dehydrogenase [Chloroflexota bacterium]
MNFCVAIIPGDGIGKEVVPAAAGVLEEVGRRFGHQFTLKHGVLGGAAMDLGLPPLPKETVDMCRTCDAILFGAVGDPKYDIPGAKVVPNIGMRQLRYELGLDINLRPARYFPALRNRTPLKPELLKGFDLVVARFFQGFYEGSQTKGRRLRWENTRGRHALDCLTADEKDIKRALDFTYSLAQTRKKKLTFVASTATFQISKLWAEIAKELSASYPDVSYEWMAPDNCAMQLMRNPAYFDVIACEISSMAGMFNNQAAMLMGSVGMAPSAVLRPENIKKRSKGGPLQWGFAFYEPIHGSSPIHAGKNEVNPIATVMCVVLMLRHSFGLEKEARAVEKAIDSVLKTHRTYDIMEPGKTRVGTKEMGELIAAGLQ